MLKRSNVDVPFSVEALKATLERLESEWDNYQSGRDRDGIYRYLESVFKLVEWWAYERKAKEYAKQALRLQRPPVPRIADPFAAIIFCTADREKVDFKTRSKWARTLRYALAYKDLDQPLQDFIKARRGINNVAARFARRLGRNSQLKKQVHRVRVAVSIL